MKKVFALLLVCLISVSFAVSSAAEEDATPVDTSDDFAYTIESDGNVIIWGYRGPKETISIPATLDGCDVVGIGERAFTFDSVLTSISLPIGLQFIGDYAFLYSSSLISLSLPVGLLSIGEGAFAMCSSLTSISLPGSLQSIGVLSFSCCSSLTYIEVSPDNPVFVAEDGVLLNRETKTLIVYPAGKTAIAYSAPQGIQSIGSVAFSDCSSLTSVSLPEGLLSIDECAFSHCSSLTSISLPGSLQSIGDSVFICCDMLTSIEVSADNPVFTVIDGVLFHRKDNVLIAYPIGKTATEYSVPQGTQSISRDAFILCPSLTSITLPDTLQSIGDQAFFGCSSLTSVRLPDSLQSVGLDVFYGCKALTLVVPRDSYAHAYAEDEGIPYRFAD